MSWQSYWGNKNSDEESKELTRVHPVWRGIGFLLMVVVPIMSFALADILLQQAPTFVDNFSIPPELQGVLSIPGYGVVNNWKAVAVLTLVISAVLFAFIAFFVSLGISMVGGSPADKLQAPVEKYEPKRKLKKRR